MNVACWNCTKHPNLNSSLTRWIPCCYLHFQLKGGAYGASPVSHWIFPWWFEPCCTDWVLIPVVSIIQEEVIVPVQATVSHKWRHLREGVVFSLGPLGFQGLRQWSGLGGGFSALRLGSIVNWLVEIRHNLNTDSLHSAAGLSQWVRLHLHQPSHERAPAERQLNAELSCGRH